MILVVLESERADTESVTSSNCFISSFDKDKLRLAEHISRHIVYLKPARGGETSHYAEAVTESIHALRNVRTLFSLMPDPENEQLKKAVLAQFPGLIWDAPYTGLSLEAIERFTHNALLNPHLVRDLIA